MFLPRWLRGMEVPFHADSRRLHLRLMPRYGPLQQIRGNRSGHDRWGGREYPPKAGIRHCARAASDAGQGRCLPVLRVAVTTLGDKMTSSGLARLDEARTRKVSSTRSTRAPAKHHTCEPGREPRVLYDGQRGERADGYWPTGMPCADRHRDGIMRTVTRHRPLRVWGKSGGRLGSNRRLRDCAMPMPR